MTLTGSVRWGADGVRPYAGGRSIRRIGTAWIGTAWIGTAWIGTAWIGTAWIGTVRMDHPVRRR
ncbi:hypothetical protein [Raineyella sp. LH-20]|uniref:hypothetical protein n=1 Tax=Raineyella sp. LH-20 TaxID=3081204 RepID=UPI002955A954|nr:hypothetical protein [Raineyella sp. LH-20]WOP18398.1 hypothetical protein R0146_14425 [Raineyella sp. LH-20]